MIDLFKSLLGGSSTAVPAPKRAVPGNSKASKVGADYRAVSLLAGIQCRVAVRDGVDKRYLLGEAPRLPLAGCATPEQCTCKYRKHADRRNDDRRLLGGTHCAAWYAGSERRARRSRRTALN
ncbi:MAG: hypothetical protein ACRESY_01665 [Steroidobacteraceae bacterium]